jgi:hypothetical protein
LSYPGWPPSKVLYPQEENALFQSANGALMGLNKVAHLESAELAEQLKATYIPRYGDDVKVKSWRLRVSTKTNASARISADCDFARKRIETGILASNVKP